jgi:hypothetical protein
MIKPSNKAIGFIAGVVMGNASLFAESGEWIEAVAMWVVSGLIYFLWPKVGDK